MEARAKLLGHPIHQMLIVFPLGLLATSVIFDVVGLVTHNGRWSEIGQWLIGTGVVGGLIAAVFGLLDWLGIPPNTRARRVGAVHGLGNVGVVGLFALSGYLRMPDPSAPSGLALALSFAAFGVAGFTGWLGGELVSQLGIGVNEGAHVDAPSSLRR